MTEETRGEPIAAKLAGMVLTFLLTVGGIFAMGWGDSSVEPRMAQFAQDTPGMIFWWREDIGVLAGLGIALLFAPMCLVPGAFGVEWRQLVPTLSPRWRTILVLGLAAAILGEAITYRLLGGRDIGVATLDGVQWLRNGEPKEQWTWAQATEVTGGCVTSRRYSWSEPKYGVDYLVSFPGKREARLSFRIEDLATWATSLEPIDEKLTATGVKRFMNTDAECLAHYEEGMLGRDKDTLRHVLRPANCPLIRRLRRHLLPQGEKGKIAPCPSPPPPPTPRSPPPSR